MRLARIAFWLIVTGLATFVLGLAVAMASFMADGSLYFVAFIAMVVSLGIVATGLVISFFVRR